jgi:hypothetical protein
MIVTIKTIPGFPDYACDEAGNVYRRKEGKLIPKSFSALNKNGHLAVNMGRGKVIPVHRMIAQTFLPDWNEDLIVHHIDEDKTNNRVSNLMMMTRQDQEAVQSKGYWLTKTNKWLASIIINGNRRYLGTFEDEQDARIAYLKAKKTLRERGDK